MAVRRWIFFIVVIFSQVAHSSPKSECERSLMPYSGRAIADNKKTQNFVKLEALITKWLAHLNAAQKNENLEAELKIFGEISDYAAVLIREHHNEEFFALAKRTPFPLNKESYEGGYVEFFYYGSSLLEAAILAKNYEIFKSLPTLSKDFDWPEQETPYINRWNQVLTSIVVNDPHFIKVAAQIPMRQGSPKFDARMADYGRMGFEFLQAIEKVDKTRSITDLKEAFELLLPSGGLAVKLKNKNAPSSNATLSFNYTDSQREKPLYGDNDQWMQINIADPKEFVRHLFGGGHYKKEMKFNLQLEHRVYEYVSKPGRQYADFTHTRTIKAEGKALNWIEELEISEGKVRVLLERDKQGREYDEGTRYQEITIAADSKGRIQTVTIKNGNQLLLRRLWPTQEVDLSGSLQSFSGVYFLGEEDMSTNEIE